MIYTEEEPLGAIPVTWEDSDDAFRTADLKGGDQADFILVTTFAPSQDSKSSILSSPTVGSVTLGNASQPLSKLTPEQLIPTPLLSPSSDLIKAILGANTLSLDSLQQTLTQHWPELRASFKDLQAFFHEVEAIFSPEVAHKLELMFQSLNSLPAVFPDQDPAPLVLEWKEIAPQFMNFWTELGKIVPEIKTLLPQEFGDKSFLLSSSTLPPPATSVENKNYSAGLTLQPLVSLTEITSPLLKGGLALNPEEKPGLGNFSITFSNSSTEVSENTSGPLSPVVKLTLPGNINQPSQSIPPVVTPPPSSNNSAPTNLTLSGNTVSEDAPGAFIGVLTAIDPDAGDTWTYQIVGPNQGLMISGDILQVDPVGSGLDYEAGASKSINIKVTDQTGNSYTKAMLVNVLDVNDLAPTNILLSNATIAENIAAGSTVGTLSPVDGDTVGTYTYSLVAGTGSTDNAAFTITGNTLTINASPDFETKSSYSIRVQVNDGVNTPFQKIFTIAISDVNDQAPTNILLSNATIAENVAAGSTVGTLSPVDGDTVGTYTYSLVAGTGSTDNAAFTITGNTLTINASPDFESKSSYSIRVQVNDGVNTFQKVFTVSVTDVNEAPTNIALSSTTIAENVAAGSTIGTFSTTDPDTGNTFTYSLVAGTGSTDNGAFSITGNTLTINNSPDFEIKPSYSIRVQVNDGVNTFQKIFTVTVTDVNEAPTNIALSSTTIAENVAAGSTIGTFSTTDPDTGNTFTYSLVAGTGSTDNAAFTITGNALTINASPDFETKSSYSIRVQVNDGVNTFQKIFTVNVTDVNEAPTDIILSTTTVTENDSSGTIGTFSTTDPDTGNTFTYSLVSGVGSADNSAFSISGNTLKIFGIPDFETQSSYSIRVQVSDGVNTFQKVFTINATDVNEAPTNIALSSTTIAENTAAGATVGTFSTTDPDTGNTFTYTLVAGTGSADNGAFTITGNTLTINNSPDFETKSSYSIRVQVNDGVNNFQKIFTVSVTDVNEAPTDIALSSTIVTESTAAGSTVGTFSTTDPDTGNTFTYTLVAGTGSTDNGAFSISGNTLTINASPDFDVKQSYSIRVQVNDGATNFQKVFTINVSDVNVPPTDIALSSNTIAENVAAGSAVGTFSAIDPDTSDVFTYSLVAGAGSTDNAAFSITGNTLSINASPDFEAKSSYSVRIQVNDGLNTFEKVFTINVTNVNEAPTDITLSPTTFAENDPSGIIGTFSTTDPDIGNTFTYTLVSGAGSTDNSAFSISGNTLKGFNSPDFESKSSYSIRVQVSDGVNTFEKVLTINITDVNEAPTNIALSSTTIAENTAAGSTVGTFSTTDPDTGNTFTYSLVGGSGSTDNAAFTITGSTLTINNSPDFETKSSYSIRVQVNDGVNNFQKIFTITISDANETPTDIALSSAIVTENTAAGSTVGTFSTTDPDTGNTFTYSLVSGLDATDNGAFTITGNALTINASPDFDVKSSYSIRVQVNDGVNAFQKVFTITVSNVNEAPTDIALSANSIAENVAAGSTVGTFSTSDPDTSDVFTYSLVAGTGSTDNGAFTITGNTLTINASPDFEAKSIYSVRVQVNDGLNTFEKVFTINVTNVNEVPTDIILSSTTVTENDPSGTIGTFSTTDPDTGNTFTYALVSGAGSTDNSAFSISGNTLKIFGIPDFETKPSYSIRVQVDDGVNTFEKVFTINVTDVNEAPTNIALSSTTIAENVAAGSTIGTFSTTDPDTGNTFTYSLVAGAGSTDNAAFTITGNALTINASPNFEAQSSYSIRVQVNDGVNTFQKVFTVSVTDVNDLAPTNILLSNATIAENIAAGSTVGTLSPVDGDTVGTYTYSLVAGTGSTDNAAFTITGNTLTINGIPNFEGQSSYSIRVQVSDGVNTPFQKVFTVNVTNVNEGPTDIIIPASVSEGPALVYSNFFSSNDPDAGATLTYTLVAGAGSTDNGSFAIIGSDLHLVSAFDFETQSSYSIRVQVSDGTNTFEKALTINITNVNETPTDIALSANSIAENVAAGSTIGTFSTTDPDTGNTFTYSLVAGTGSTDNAAFTITGNTLTINGIPNFEGQSSYSIRVQVNDGVNNFQKVFTINITNVNETPTNITLSSTSIAENVAAGSTVGTFSTTDPDAGNTFTYSLVAGTGSTDNGAFTITGNTLTINGIPNFEGQSSYAIRVRTTDQNGLSFDKQLTISVTNVNEVPVIGGITALTNMFDTNTVTPFSNVTLSEPENDTVTVTITFPINGTLSGGGFNVSVPGTATFTGTVAAAQAAIRALVFNPTDTTGAGSLGNDITTTFTITVTDGLLPTSNSSTIVHVTQGLGSAAGNTFTLPFAISTGGLLDTAGGTDSVTLANGTNTFSVANLETLIGGSGADTITYTTNLAAGATINLNGGIDTVILSTAGNNSVTISNVENISVANSTARADALTFSSAFLSANNSVVDLGQGTDIVSLYGGGAVGNTVKLQNVEVISINNNVGNQQVVTVEVDASGVTSSTISTVTLGTNTANQIYFNSFNAFDGTTNVNYNITVDGMVSSILSNDFGIGNDTFTYTAAFATGKFVNGGLGSDTIVLSNTTQTFTTTGVSAVEQIKTPVSATSNYNITIADATVATTTGLNFKVDASTTSGTTTINGSAVISGNLTLMGGSGANTLTGGSGDDTLSSAAGVTSNINIFQGGIGNDILQYNGNMGATAVYNGGSGNADVLSFLGSTNQSLNLNTASATNIVDIEVIDMTGAGTNTLTLNASEVLGISSTSNTLRILGTNVDTVTQTNGAGTWISDGQVVIESNTYNQYHNSTSPTAILQIQASITNFIP